MQPYIWNVRRGSRGVVPLLQLRSERHFANASEYACPGRGAGVFSVEPRLPAVRGKKKNTKSVGHQRTCAGGGAHPVHRFEEAMHQQTCAKGPTTAQHTRNAEHVCPTKKCTGVQLGTPTLKDTLRLSPSCPGRARTSRQGLLTSRQDLSPSYAALYRKRFIARPG